MCVCRTADNMDKGKPVRMERSCVQRSKAEGYIIGIEMGSFGGDLKDEEDREKGYFTS